MDLAKVLKGNEQKDVSTRKDLFRKAEDDDYVNYLLASDAEGLRSNQFC